MVRRADLQAPPAGLLPADPSTSERASHATVAARVSAIAQRRRDRIAISSDAGRWTFGTLLERSAAIAAEVQVRSPDPAAPVAVLVPHGPFAVAAALGLMSAGRIWVPLDPAHPAARLRTIVADAGARSVVAAASTAALAAGLAGDVITADVLPAGGAAPADLPGHDAAATACILYTSGSTGRPKGVVHSHANLVHFATGYVRQIGLTPEDRHAVLQPLSFSRTFKEVFGPLTAGAGVCLVDVPRLGWGQSIELLRRDGATVLGSAVTAARHLARSTDGVIADTLRLVYVGAEPLGRPDLELLRSRLPGDCVVVHGFGATETGTCLRYVVAPGTELRRRIVPSGREVDGIELRLVDAAGLEVADGEVGSIEVVGRFLSPGYWCDPERTRRRFFDVPGRPGVRGFRTGDVGRRLPDGTVEHLGRADSQVKIRGQRVELGEIEACLGEHAAVQDAAVVAVPSRAGEVEIVAWVTRSGDGSCDPSDLRAYVAARLPDAMVPGRVRAVDELPTTPNGKIDRGRVAELEQGLALDGVRGPSVEEGAPAAEVERDEGPGAVEAGLIAIWSRLLGVERIGRDDSFFALGGTSLLALRMLEEIRLLTGLGIGLEQMVAGDTVADIAALISDSARRAPRS